jgi:hypothetical protein
MRPSSGGAGPGAVQGAYKQKVRYYMPVQHQLNVQERALIWKLPELAWAGSSMYAWAHRWGTSSRAFVHETVYGEDTQMQVIHYVGFSRSAHLLGAWVRAVLVSSGFVRKREDAERMYRSPQRHPSSLIT